MTVDGGVATLIVGGLTVLTMLFLAVVGGVTSLVFRVLDALHKQREALSSFKAEIATRVSALEAEVSRAGITGLHRAVQSWEENNPVPEEVLERMRSDPAMSGYSTAEIEQVIQAWDREMDSLLGRERTAKVTAKIGTVRYIVATLNGIKGRREATEARTDHEDGNPSFFGYLRELWG